MAKSKHKTQTQDQDHQNDQDRQDQRPLLRRNTPRIFGSSRPPPDEDKPIVLLYWTDLPRKGIRYHHNHIRRMWEAGKFPQPFKLSERRLAWREADIDQWILDKIAESE